MFYVPGRPKFIYESGAVYQWHHELAILDCIPIATGQHTPLC